MIFFETELFFYSELNYFYKQIQYSSHVNGAIEELPWDKM